MKPDRVVLDVNVYVSFILSRKLDLLVIWAKDYNITIYTCNELLDELTAVLARGRINKHLNSPAQSYVRFIKTVTKNIQIDLRFDRAPDLKDNYLFDLAYTAKSNFIVTRDRPLLNMKQVNKIKVISLTDWNAQLKK